MSNSRVSVVVPVSERHQNLIELIGQYRGALLQAGYQLQFICVLDGKYAQLLQELQDLQKETDDLTIVQLSRSFGEATALKAGFDAATEEIILTLPAYPQVTPDSIPELVREIEDYDLVVGVRWPRKDGMLNRLQARAFNWLVSRFADEPYRDLGCGARAIRRDVLQHIQIYGDQHRFIPILAGRAGFNTKEIELPQSTDNTRRRLYSPGVYVRRLLDVLTVLFLVKFTKKPLRFFGLLGTGFTVIGGSIVGFLVIERILGMTELADRPAFLLGAVMLVLGVQLFAIGLIGELIIFANAKRQKEYVIEQIVN